MDEIDQDVIVCLAALAGFVGLLREKGTELTEAQRAYLVKAEEAAQKALRAGLSRSHPSD